jgi:hypothetical protein
LCKIGFIQHRLATIRGWYSALGVIPSVSRFSWSSRPRRAHR